MKHVNEFISEIKTIEEKVKSMPATWFTSKKAKSLDRKIKKLKWYRNYLETNPTEESIRKQISMLEARRENIMQNFNVWCTTNKHKHDNPLSAYKKEMSIGKINDQIKRLNF